MLKLTQVTAFLALKGLPHVTVARSPETALEMDWCAVFALAYRAYYAAQTGHWNTRGPGFAQDHAMFQAQYEFWQTTVDEIAEHIRVFDIELPERLSALSSEPTTTPLADAVKYIEFYVQRLTALLPKLNSICKQSQDLGDNASDNFAQGLVQSIKTQAWKTASALPEPNRSEILRELRTNQAASTDVQRISVSAPKPALVKPQLAPGTIPRV